MVLEPLQQNCNDMIQSHADESIRLQKRTMQGPGVWPSQASPASSLIRFHPSSKSAKHVAVCKTPTTFLAAVVKSMLKGMLNIPWHYRCPYETFLVASLPLRSPSGVCPVTKTTRPSSLHQPSRRLPSLFHGIPALRPPNRTL